MKQPDKKPDPYSVILIEALIGAVGGGYWLGLALAVLSSPNRSLFDLVACVVCVSLLAAIACILTDHHGRPLLRFFSALTVVSVLLSYITH